MKTVAELEQAYYKAVARWRAVMNDRKATNDQYFKAEAKKDAALKAWQNAQVTK